MIRRSFLRGILGVFGALPFVGKAKAASPKWKGPSKPLKVTIDGRVYAAESFTITITNKIDPDRFFNSRAIKSSADETLIIVKD